MSFSVKPEPEDARLVGGGSSCSGRMEMKHQGEWRALSIQDDRAYIRLRYAQVACRQMGCGSAVSMAASNRADLIDQQPVWEVYFICRGDEATLSKCNARKTKGRVKGNVTSIPSLEVICSELVRLPGDNRCVGSVKVKSDRGWVPVCEDGFVPETESLVCRELGCGPPEFSKKAFTKEGAPVVSKQFQCNGNESRLEGCSSSIRNNCRPASEISCSDGYDTRLVAGETRCEDTLEGNKGGEWRPLIDMWGLINPKSFEGLCRQLGCAEVTSVSTFSQKSHRLVWELPSSCGGFSLCKSWNRKKSLRVMNVTCSEALRLVNGPNRCSGKLEVRSNESWFSVSASYFDHQAALVTCRTLDCGFPSEYFGRFSRHFASEEHNWNSTFNCEGTEKHLMDCPSTTVNATEVVQEIWDYGDAHLICTERPPPPHISAYIPLKDDYLDFSEVVEGHSFTIICEVSSQYKIQSIRLKYGVDTDATTELIDSPVDQQAVFMFPAAEKAHNGTFTCDYNYNFSPEIFSEPTSLSLTVVEPDYVRLMSTESRCAGTLELKNENEWRPVSHLQSWSLKEAAVLCRQMSCGSAVSTSKADISTSAWPVWRFFSDCDGSEPVLLNCGTVKHWFSSSTVQVVCSDILLQPNICVYSMRKFPDEHQYGVRLYKYSSFTINCSVEPQYPGGHFILSFTGVNQTSVHTQPAVNHSALFRFTSVVEANQGNYSCVYHNFVFNHNFTSESQNLSISLIDEEDLWLDDGVFSEFDSVVCAGKVLVYHENRMSFLSAESRVWDLKHASVVCRQLGCGSAVTTKEIHLPKKERVWRFFSDCDGSESSLLSCGTVTMWFSSTAIEVVCTGHQNGAAKGKKVEF